MRPGVTYEPRASTVFFAPLASMRAATAAIFPSVTAMSRTASMPFFGSMT
jgi:hypothetical protein